MDKKCKWTEYTYSNNQLTECGVAFESFCDASIHEFKYCPYCGRILNHPKYNEETEEWYHEA